MAEQETGDPAQGSSSGSLGLEMQQVPGVDPSQSPCYHQIIFISARHLGLSRTKASQSITGQGDQ